MEHGKKDVKCGATAATTGNPDAEIISLKYHKILEQNHPPNECRCLVNSSLADFREKCRTEVDRGVKIIYEEVTSDLLQSVDPAHRLGLSKEIPVFRSVKKAEDTENVKKIVLR